MIKMKGIFVSEDDMKKMDANRNSSSFPLTTSVTSFSGSSYGLLLSIE